MADTLPGFSCAILAGGEGSRLRAEKALLPLGDQYLVETLIENLRSLFADIMLVVRSEHSPCAPCGKGGSPGDRRPAAQRPLGGIHSALHYSEAPFCFVIACDMPFPSLSLLRHMMRQADGHAAVVPRRGYYIEPSSPCTDALSRTPCGSSWSQAAEDPRFPG